jgi:4-alpha-glucanotransferase
LPGRQGIGVLGAESLRLIDALAAAGIRYWQVLPLGPTGFGDSPYSSFSAFAGNPYLIDLQPLVDHGLLAAGDLAPLEGLPQHRVDFGGLHRTKWPLLRLAWRRFQQSGRAYLPNYGLFDAFCAEHEAWLLPYARFMALKDSLGGAFLGDWPANLRTWSKARRSPVWKQLQDAVQSYCFFQYLFFGQWRLIQAHARSRQVRIIGDIPIFVALDSCDVWSKPELFQLDAHGVPAVVAGVPPDYFSPTGQLWGNPLYDWAAMAESGFDWWIARMRHNLALCDVLRIDHFRGLWDYWEIPAGSVDARAGAWRDGPRDAFMQQVFAALPGARIIAEDLGDIHDGVRAYRDRWGLPGMSVLQFAWDGGGDNLYLPHNLVPNSVCYTGTHDNDTSAGWYEAAAPVLQDQVRRYLRVSGEDIAWDFVRAAFATVSRLCIIPMQDFLALGGADRMNRPGVPQGNWQWRMHPRQLDQFAAGATYLRELAWLYGRG